MGCFTKTIGRLLFVTLLFSSAYLHLTNQTKFIGEFTQNYNHLLQFVAKHIPNTLPLPVATAVNWNLWIRVLGLFEALTALLILFGDGLGGVFLLLTLVVSGVFDYCNICSFLQWEVTRQLQFARYVFFVGAALTMICTGCKKASKSCN